MSLLYFPSIKIYKCDFIPNQQHVNYIFHFKSNLTSPTHYPKNQLIIGKVEFVGTINNQDYFQYWFNDILKEINLKNIKNKNISTLVEFKENNSQKFFLVGIGKEFDFAYFFSNKSKNLTSEETLAKINYDLKIKNIKDKSKIKI